MNWAMSVLHAEPASPSLNPFTKINCNATLATFATTTTTSDRRVRSLPCSSPWPTSAINSSGSPRAPIRRYDTAPSSTSPRANNSQHSGRAKTWTSTNSASPITNANRRASAIAGPLESSLPAPRCDATPVTVTACRNALNHISGVRSAYAMASELSLVEPR